jgi:hypothetical protein
MRVVDTAGWSGTIGCSVSSSMLLQSLLALCWLRLNVKCLGSFWFSIVVALYTMCATCALFLFYLLRLLFSICSIFLIFVDSPVLVIFITFLTSVLNKWLRSELFVFNERTRLQGAIYSLFEACFTVICLIAALFAFTFAIWMLSSRLSIASCPFCAGSPSKVAFWCSAS